MIAKSATSDDAVSIDQWLRTQGFAGDAQNNSLGNTAAMEGYRKDALVVLLVTPIASDGATAQATELAVYAGILPGEQVGT